MSPGFDFPTSIGLENVKDQNKNVRDLPGDGLLEILAIDKEKDVVFLGNNFGVTFTIAIEEIADIYLKNRNNLTESGYNLDKFFGIE